MSQLGVTVTTNEQLQGGAGIPVNTGTAFFAGTCDAGPPPSAGTAYIKCQSINDYVTAFGPRSSTSSRLYDAVDTFFHEGGSVCYVTRVTDSTAVAATLTLNDAGARPTVQVTALTAGTAGNAIYIADSTSGSRYTVTVQDADGNVLETHGPFTATSSLFAERSAYVTFTQSTASGNTTNIPATASAAPLTGGADANDLTDASAVAALANFSATLGPGTVALPGYTSTTAWTGLRAHAKANNRFPAIDLADSPTAATLISALGTYGTGADASYTGVPVSSSCVIPGLTPGTTRTVAGSAVVAALRARVAVTGNDNQAPIGRDWPLAYVQGFTNTYSDADMATLNAAGINCFANRYGVLCLFGFSTAVRSDTDPIFWQAAPAAERMALVAQGAQILEGYFGKPLDGRDLTITAAQGELQALVARHWIAGALYGDTATDAGSVLVGPPINTPSTEQAGQLNANLKVRISPFAQAINLTITSVPITQSV